jgi:hypothetical protein
VQKPSVSAGVLSCLSFAIERKAPAGDNKKEKYHWPPEAIKAKNINDTFFAWGPISA